MTTSLEKLTWIVRRLIHQSGGDMHLVPNYPCWKSRKSTLSLDKRIFLSGINTNSLTPTWAKLPLDPINHILTIFFAFTPLFSATYYIYSHPLLCHYWLYHWSPFGRYHTGATPLFVSYHVVSKHTFFFQKYEEYHYFIKRFLGFCSILERVMHALVVEKNLTPIGLMS